MNCETCKNGGTHPGKTTITVDQNDLILVIRNIPAEVCDNCGEAYMDEDVAQRVYELAQETAKSGFAVGVRNYVAA